MEGARVTHVTFVSKIIGVKQLFQNRIRYITDLPHFPIFLYALPIEEMTFLMNRFIGIWGRWLCPIVFRSVVLRLAFQHEHHCLILPVFSVLTGIHAKPNNAIAPGSRCESIAYILIYLFGGIFDNYLGICCRERIYQRSSSENWSFFHNRASVSDQALYYGI